MITFQGPQRKTKPRREERRPVLVRLAPEDFNLLATACAESGRSYGECIGRLLYERRMQAKQEAEA
jgi:hypothetical protein